MKKILSLIALLGVISFSTNNLYSYSTEDDKNDNLYTTSSVDSYSKYYEEFKKEFYSDLVSGNTSRIDGKIKSYTADSQYLEGNTDSEHYKHLEEYKLKVKVLTDLKNNFINNNGETSSNSTSSLEREPRMCTMDYNPVCGSDNKTYGNACSAGAMKIKHKGECKIEKETEDDDLNPLKEIISSLETELKTLRESITKENIEEIKVKTEELKRTYLNKVESVNPDWQKQITQRFDIFFKNQFQVREELKNTKESIKINGIKNPTNQNGKTNYKDSFKSKYASKLESFSTEQLNVAVSKIDKLIKVYKTDPKKTKVILQLEALKDVITEIIDNRETSSEIDALLNSIK